MREKLEYLESLVELTKVIYQLKHDLLKYSKGITTPKDTVLIIEARMLDYLTNNKIILVKGE
jgi:hypothetical protein